MIYIAVGLLLLAGCSGDVTRMGGKADLSPAPMSRDEERKNIVNQGKDFCAKYPDDIACPGKGFKK